MTVEGCEDKGLPFPNIFLEVHQPFWNHKHLTRGEHFGVEHVTGGRESDKEPPLDDDPGLGRTRVRVGRIKSAGSEIDAVHRNPQRVQPRKAEDVSRSQAPSISIACIAFFAQAIKEEVIWGYFGGRFAGEAIDSYGGLHVSDAEVL